MAPQRYRYYDRFNKTSLTITLPKELKELIKLGDPNEIITFLLEENYDRISDGKVSSLIDYRRNKLRLETEKIIHKVIEEHIKRYTIKLREESEEVKLGMRKIIKEFNQHMMEERKMIRGDITSLTEKLFDEILREELHDKRKANRRKDEATEEKYLDEHKDEDEEETNAPPDLEEDLKDLEEEWS